MLLEKCCLTRDVSAAASFLIIKSGTPYFTVDRLVPGLFRLLLFVVAAEPFCLKKKKKQVYPSLQNSDTSPDIIRTFFLTGSGPLTVCKKDVWMKRSSLGFTVFTQGMIRMCFAAALLHLS